MPALALSMATVALAVPVPATAPVALPGGRPACARRRRSRAAAAGVRRSGDVAATRALAIAGRARVERLARRARMRGFRVADPWGLSPVRASDQARFFLRLPERLPPRHRAYACACCAPCSASHGACCETHPETGGVQGAAPSLQSTGRPADGRPRDAPEAGMLGASPVT